ncbi:MAG TPA: F0F1 ATP synthase subunit B [Candidatus Manganitrophaceae bacterium]|nr:F0F1 ATP synthase subunit B [Candidatus Manganitrophaceae bacterium]
MRKFAWRPLLAVIDERRLKISSELEAIKTGKESLASMQREYQLKIEEIENHARSKIQEAVVQGQQAAKEISDTARKEADHILEKAKENITVEITKAKVQLRDEIATLAISAAEKIVRQEMDKQKNKELVLQYLDEVKGYK